MTTVQEIEKAVQRLPERELYSFRSWFDEFDACVWDKQFEQDVQSGRLDALADQAAKDLKANRSGCEPPRKSPVLEMLLRPAVRHPDIG